MWRLPQGSRIKEKGMSEGHANRKIRLLTEYIMQEAEKRIDERKEPKLTTGQYNSMYEAVGKILDGNV